MSSNVTPLVEDVIRPAGMYDPELTYYADGTHVVVRGVTDGSALRNGRTGVTHGRTVGSSVYPFQAVRWDDDGTTANVAPHVLARVVGTGEYGGGECVYTLAGHDTDGTAFYHCHAHDATEVSPDAPCANAPHGVVDPVKRGPAPLSTRPRDQLTARAVAAYAAPRSRTLTFPGAPTAAPAAREQARAEYVAARERGETVPLALSRARAEMVAHRVLSWADPDTDADGAPYGSGDALDAYDVDPRELYRVTSDPRTATLAGEVRDAETGALILSPVILPDGATARVYVYADDDATPYEGPVDTAVGEAWERDEWRYVGVTAVVTLADGARGEASLWGVEMGDYWPGSEAAQIWHTIPDLVSEAHANAVCQDGPENSSPAPGTLAAALAATGVEPFPGIRVTFYRGERDARPVVQIDTDEGAAVRVRLNDGPALFDGDPQTDEPPAANLAAWVRAIVDELKSEVDYAPAAGFDDGYTSGVDMVLDRLREVLDAEAAR